MEDTILGCMDTIVALQQWSFGLYLGDFSFLTECIIGAVKSVLTINDFLHSAAIQHLVSEMKPSFSYRLFLNSN
jgi:hypothetical protein